MEIAPTFAAPPPSGQSALLQRRGVRTALRVLAVLAGVAGSLAGLVVTGAISVLSYCGDDSTGLCTNYAGVVPVLEWALVIVAFAAPLAGGIVSCIRQEWPWLAAGLLVAIAMVALADLIQTGQTAAFS